MERVITQNHHIVYENLAHGQKEIIAKLYLGEHHIMTLLQRQTKHISKGFIKSLKHWLALNEDKALEIKNV